MSRSNLKRLAELSGEDMDAWTVWDVTLEPNDCPKHKAAAPTLSRARDGEELRCFLCVVQEKLAKVTREPTDLPNTDGTDMRTAHHKDVG